VSDTPAAEEVRRGPLGALVAEGFFSRLSFGIISFVLPLYAYQLDLGLAEIGMLLGFNTVVAMALKVPLGWVADRLGYRRVLLVAIALRSAVSLLLVFAAAPWQLFAIRGLHGVSIALRDPATASLLAVHGGKKRIASSFAWYQTAKGVAGSVGKGAGGLVLGLSGANFSLPFLIAFALSALPLWVVVRYLHEPAADGAAPARTAADDLEAQVLVEMTPPASGALPPDAPVAAPPAARPPVLAAAVFGFLVTGTAYMMANLFPVLAVEHAGLTESQTGLIFLLAAGVTLTGPLFGWLSDTVSHRLVLAVRSVANIVSSAIYLVAPSFGGFATAKLTDDLGKAAFKPAWGALMARVAELDPRRRARTMSAVSLGEDAGEIAGPVVAGLLWSTWGIGALFGVRMLLAIATELYGAGLERRLGVGRRAPSADPADIKPGPGRLELRSVRLSDGMFLDCTVEPPEVLALDADSVDELAAVLTGRRPPLAGRVLLDDHDLARVGPAAAGRLVAVVDATRLAGVATVGQAMARVAAPAEAVARGWSLGGAARAVGPLWLHLDTPLAVLNHEARWAVTLAAELARDPSLVVVTGDVPIPVQEAVRRYPGAAVVVRASSADAVGNALPSSSPAAAAASTD